MRAVSLQQKGFSLLEILVAFVIMAFSLGALYQATGGTVRSLGDTELSQRATMLAQSVLDSRDGVPEAGWNESGASGGLAWRVSSAPFASGISDSRANILHEIRVVISWSDRRGGRQLEVTTLLPQTLATAPR